MKFPIFNYDDDLSTGMQMIKYDKSPEYCGECFFHKVFL